MNDRKRQIFPEWGLLIVSPLQKGRASKRKNKTSNKILRKNVWKKDKKATERGRKHKLTEILDPLGIL